MMPKPAKRIPQTPSVPPATVAPPIPERILRPITSLGEDRTEPIKGIRRAMTKAMEKSLRIPHFGYKDEIDLTRLVSLMPLLKEAALQRGIEKFSYMPVFIKVSINT